MKNWIISAQGFLMNCATDGFMENYEAIMDGTFKKDLFYGTEGEGLMELLGSMAYLFVFSSRAIYKMELTESTILDFLMDRFVGTVLCYDTDEEQDSIDSRVVAFISDNYKNAYSLQSKRKKRGREVISPPASCDRLCVWYDRQLCETSVSGDEWDYIIIDPKFLIRVLELHFFTLK